MARYLATYSREVTIEAPSAADARALAEKVLARTLKPSDIRRGMSVGNLSNAKLHVEKVKD